MDLPPPPPPQENWLSDRLQMLDKNMCNAQRNKNFKKQTFFQLCS
jgi:hypothetical protein